VLRQLIGTADDFFMTSLAAQGNLNKFFEEKSTARKQIIGKFLNLDIFDALYERSREDLVPLRASFRGRRDKQQIDAKIADAVKMLAVEREKTSELDNAHSDLTRKLADLRVIINGDTSVEAAVKLRELEQRRDRLAEKHKEYTTQIEDASALRSKHTVRLEKFSALKEKFPIDELRQKVQSQRSLETKLEAANRELQQHLKSLGRLNEDVGILSTVPCGDEFPTCPFIKKAFESKSKIGQEQLEVEEQRKYIKQLQADINEIAEQNLDEKVKKYDVMLQEERTLQFDVSKLDMKIEHAEASLKTVNGDLATCNLEIDRLSAVVNDSDNLCGVYDSIKEVEEELEKTRKLQLTNAKNVGAHETSITTLQSEKETLERDLADLEIFELFNVAMSKKGLPSRLISKLLPLVNAEIQNILLGVCNFTVELEVDEESNSLEVYINYGDKRRIIELGSGMEKMISAIATRVALINMSSLPKSNIFIIDEGFGALDDTNLEACSRLLRSLKKHFNQILIISHVDAIKDAVDNFVEINWIDGGASVRYS
jgi:DNA repair exonuclease SbcCD ATPase subunit